MLVTLTNEETRADIEEAITNVRAFQLMGHAQREQAISDTIDVLLDEWQYRA